MPPRIRGPGCPPQPLLQSLDPLYSASLVSTVRRPTAPSSRRHAPPCASGITNTTTTTAAAAATTFPAGSRPFSSTPSRQVTQLRRRFQEWLGRFESSLKEAPRNGSTNYVTKVMVPFPLQEIEPNMPFPNNPHFRSQPVLSEEAREKIWRAVMLGGMPLKAVSAEFNVDMRRVAAVVRMKEIEKKWERENKPLAHPYAAAILNMLPRAKLVKGEPPFEPINDIHVHSYTMQQLFVPTSESRQFTREDAARAFGEHILPPDAKMRIPELVELERKVASGVEPALARAELIREAAESERALAERRRARQQAAEERRIRVDSGRFEFRFDKINAEEVGRTGRARKAVGWRYGAPFMDRKRGQIKIPTSVG